MNVVTTSSLGRKGFRLTSRISELADRPTNFAKLDLATAREVRLWMGIMMRSFGPSVSFSVVRRTGTRAKEYGSAIVGCAGDRPTKQLLGG